MGKEKKFDFSWDTALSQRRDWRRDIINTTIKEHDTYLSFDFGKRYVSVLFVKNYPSGLSDSFVKELMALPFPIITTFDVEPVDTDYASKMLMQKYMSAQRTIDKQQERKNKNGNFSSDVSYDKRKEVEELEEGMDGLRSFDEKMFYGDILIAVNAESKEVLNNHVEQVKTIGDTYTLDIEEHICQQLDALNTVLPTAARFVDTMRPLFTTALSGFIPFNVQEINDDGGFFYGINQVSKNAIIGNRKKLKNGNGFIFGKSGSGKSQDGKFEIGQVMTYTDDDIIIIDPMGEYEQITNEWGGNYFKFKQDGQNSVYKNPLHVPNYIENQSEFITEKAEFLYALCEQAIKPDILTNKHINVIDKAVKEMYEDFFDERNAGNNPESPTLVTLSEKFIKFYEINNDKYAKDMAEQMGIFTTGTLNIFAHQETRSESNRLEVYGLSNLGKKMKKLAMLVAIEAVKSKLKYNQKNDKATWVYVDEVHEMWKDEYAIAALEDLWREVRKQGGLCTGMTQFIMDGLGNDSTASMIGNSEFTLLLEQGTIDKANLFEIFEVSNAQLKYVNGVEPGTGLIRFGKKIIPFDNVMEKGSKLYELFNTSFHEDEAGELSG
jgi:type IV secretory pathway VirB4 component